MSLARRVLVVLLLGTSWPSCGASAMLPASPEPGPAIHVVHMLDAPPYFDRLVVEARVGDTIVWENSGPVMVHTILNEDLTLASGDIPVGQAWRFTPQQAGVYAYLCFRHFFMRGTLVVRNPDGSTKPLPREPYQAAFKEFVVPTPQAVPRMIIASRTADVLWFTEGGGDFYGFEDIPAQNKLGQIDESGRIVEYATPTPNGDGSAVGVDSLVMDRGGVIWFTERLTNRVGRLDPSGAIREFALPRPDGYALGVDLDSQGNLWIAERYANRLGRLTPAGEVTEIELPDKDSEPRTVFVDRQDRVWYTARAANEIGSYDPRNGRFTRFQIPTKLARPAGICATSDGTLYFVEMVGNKVAKIVGDRIVEYPLPTKFSAPFKCVADAQDHIWFTQVFGNSIGKLETATGRITEYRIPTPDSRPGGIALDRHGRIWFTEQKGNKIGMFDPAQAEAAAAPPARSAGPTMSAVPTGPTNPTNPGPAGPSAPSKQVARLPSAPTNLRGTAVRIEDFRVPTPGAAPGNDLLEDEEGWLWFPEIFGNKVGALHLRSRQFRELELPTSASLPVGLAKDPGGLLWVTQFRGNKLARLDPATGAVEEYGLPREGALPAGITVDDWGQVWLTELAVNRIARFDPVTHRFTEFELPRPESSPLQIAADRQGALWITASEERGNYLARFDVRTARFEIFELPIPNAAPVGLLLDAGAVWVAAGGAGALVRLDLQRRAWETFRIPAEPSEPVKLAKDRAGRIWITDGGGLGSAGGNRLAVFDPIEKTFTLIPMKTRDAKPMGIIAASDGHIWFTQQGANRISRVVPEEDQGRNGEDGEDGEDGESRHGRL